MKKAKKYLIFFGLLLIAFLVSFLTKDAFTMLLIGAVITGNVLGDMKNRIGQIVTFKWKGIQAMRSYVIPTYSRTTPQGTQRDLFKGVLAFGQGILGSIIQTYLYPYAVGMSSFNAWMRKNLLAWTSPTTFDKAVITWGSLSAQLIDTAVYAGSDVTISWTEALVGNQSTLDTAMGVVYDSSTKLFYISAGTETRGDNSLTVACQNGLTSTNLKAYLFFFRDINTVDYKLGNSDYSAVTT